MPRFLMPYVIAACTLAAILCFVAARRLRRAPGLPPNLSGADIEDAHRLSRRICELGRRLPGPTSTLLVYSLLVADAAATLALAAPVLLPDLAPATAAGLVVLVALLFGKLLAVAVHGLAATIRRAQVRISQGRLARSPRQADRDDADLIRQVFRATVTDWPLPPRWTWQPRCWIGITPWVLLIGLLVGMQLMLRVLTARTAEDFASIVVLAVLALGSVVFATREALAAESLSDEVALARRIVARFPSPGALQDLVASHRQAVEQRLHASAAVIANVLEVRDPYEEPLTIDVVGAWKSRMREPAAGIDGGAESSVRTLPRRLP